MIDKLKDYFEQSRRAYKERRPWALIIALLSFLILAASIIVLGVKVWEIIKPTPKLSEYKIALVGPVKGKEEQTWAGIKAGIDAAIDSGLLNELKGKNINIQFIQHDDKDVPEMSQQIAETICRDENYITADGLCRKRSCDQSPHSLQSV